MATLTPAYIDRLTHVRDFAQAVVSLLTAWLPGEAAQAAFAHEHYSWSRRAAMLESL